MTGKMARHGWILPTPTASSATSERNGDTVARKTLRLTIFTQHDEYPYMRAHDPGLRFNTATAGQTMMNAVARGIAPQDKDAYSVHLQELRVVDGNAWVSLSWAYPHPE